MEVVVIIKPDVIIANEIADMKKMIKEELWNIEISTMVQLDREFLSDFYYQYKNEDFFEKNIVENMTKSPVIAMIVSTHNSIRDFDQVLEVKKKIREKFAKDKSNNSIHISDSFKSALLEREKFGW